MSKSVIACINNFRRLFSSLSRYIWKPFDAGGRAFDFADFIGFFNSIYQRLYAPYSSWAEQHFDDVRGFARAIIDAIG